VDIIRILTNYSISDCFALVKLEKFRHGWLLIQMERSLILDILLFVEFSNQISQVLASFSR